MTGSDISLIQGSEDDGGVDLYLGPDALSNVQSAVSHNCPGSECQSSVQSAMNPPQLGLQARALRRLIGAAVVALVGIAISAFGLANSNNHVYLPGPDLSQVSSAQIASTVVYATASDDPNMLTVTESFPSAGASG